MNADDEYKKLINSYYATKRILKTLTPESGPVYDLYMKRMEELMKRYKPRDKTPKPKKIGEKRSHKKKPEEVDLNNLPVNFHVSW